MQYIWQETILPLEEEDWGFYFDAGSEETLAEKKEREEAERLKKLEALEAQKRQRRLEMREEYQDWVEAEALEANRPRFRAHYLKPCQSQEYITSDGKKEFVQLVQFHNKKWGVQKILLEAGQTGFTREMLYQNLSYMQAMRHLMSYERLQEQSGYVSEGLSPLADKPHYLDVLEAMKRHPHAVTEDSAAPPKPSVAVSGVKVEQTDAEMKASATSIYQPRFYNGITADKIVGLILKGKKEPHSVTSILENLSHRVVLDLSTAMKQPRDQVFEYCYRRYCFETDQINRFFLLSHQAVICQERKFLERHIKDGTYRRYFQRLQDPAETSLDRGLRRLIGGCLLLDMAQVPPLYDLLMKSLPEEERQKIHEFVISPLQIYLAKGAGYQGATGEESQLSCEVAASDLAEMSDFYLGNDRFIPFVSAVFSKVRGAERVALSLLRRGALEDRLNISAQGYPEKITMIAKVETPPTQARMIPMSLLSMSKFCDFGTEAKELPKMQKVTRPKLLLWAAALQKRELAAEMLQDYPQLLKQEVDSSFVQELTDRKGAFVTSKMTVEDALKYLPKFQSLSPKRETPKVVNPSLKR